MGIIHSNKVIVNNEVTYLFVDGNWLKGALKELSTRWFHAPISIDYGLLALDCKATKCFFYDAYPPEDDPDFKDETKAKDREFAAISAIPGWHVVTGLTRGKRGGKNRLQQKGVDLKLGIDAITHRIRGNFARAVLIVGDLDFLPLVNALVELGAWVEIWCDPTKTSKDLYLAADGRTWINIPSVGTKQGRFHISGKRPPDPAWEQPPGFLASGDVIATGFAHSMVYQLFKTAAGGEMVATNSEMEVSVWKHPDPQTQLYFMRSQYPEIEWESNVPQQ